MTDHDLLIRLDTLLEGVLAEIKEIKNTKIADLEDRVRLLERGYWKTAGVIGVVALSSEVIGHFVLK